MRIDPGELGAERIYRLMTGIVVPRPIAWVTSLSRKGVLDLAPFSAFTLVSQKPPMLAISVGRKGPDYKEPRTTSSTPGYVIHIADTPLMGAVHDSSVEHPPEVSEVERSRTGNRAERAQGAAACRRAGRDGSRVSPMPRIRPGPQPADRRRGGDVDRAQRSRRRRRGRARAFDPIGRVGSPAMPGSARS